MPELAVYPRTVFPYIRRIVVNLLQRITFILPVDVFHPDFKRLFFKQRRRIVDLARMLHRRSVVDVPLRIFARQIIIPLLHFHFRTSFTIVRRLAEAVRKRQQFVLLAGRMLEIDIHVRRTESTFGKTVAVEPVDGVIRSQSVLFRTCQRRQDGIQFGKALFLPLNRFTPTLNRFNVSIS